MRWVSRTIRAVLTVTERARRTRNIASNATCTFLHSSDDTGATDGLVAGPDIVIPGRQASHSRSQGGPRNSGVEAEQVDFGQYVDQVGRDGWCHSGAS
jgi:chloride channel 3/4/5